MSDKQDKFEREARYIVLKMKDVNAALTPKEREDLFILYSKTDKWRMDAGKGHLGCVVVESDWPEFEPTWAAIEKRMTRS